MTPEQRARLDNAAMASRVTAVTPADLGALLAAYDTAVAALQTMLEASEAEAEALFHNFDGSCNCRMCTVLIPMMRTALSGEDKR
jgi:hypothetical protein